MSSGMSDRQQDRNSRGQRSVELDVARLKGDMNAMQANLTAALADFRTDLANFRTDLANLRADMAARDGKRDAEMAKRDGERDAKMAKRETWFFGVIITGFVTLGAAITIFGIRDAPPPVLPAAVTAPPQEARTAPTATPESPPPVDPEN